MARAGLLVVVAAGCAGEAADGPLPAAEAAAPPEATAPTFYRDVAPILARRCRGCHDAGGIAPFALATRDDATARHAAIAAAVATRAMPPWLPGDGCGTYVDARRLADDEIATLVAWSRAGAPAGEPAPLPAPARPRELARVDEVVDIGVDYVARPADGPLDDWRCFVVDPGFAEDRVMVGYDLAPTLRAQVHHAAFVEVSLADARAKDDADPGPGWACSGAVGVGGRVLGSWAAGYGAVELPAGTGMRIAAGSGLAVQVHYHLHDAATPPTPDRTKIALELAPPGAAVREASFLSVGTTSIDVPPRSIGVRAEASYVLPTAISLSGVSAHMHLFGRRVRAELVEGDRTTCLLDIPRWDYHWEEMYFLPAARVLPAGSTLKLTCTWDNPTDRDVGFGLTLADEMCDFGAITTPP